MGITCDSANCCSIATASISLSAARPELGISHSTRLPPPPPTADLNEYYALLIERTRWRAGNGTAVNAVTINETHFFRDAAQFDALTQTVLPELIERRRMLRTLRIWSAGLLQWRRTVFPSLYCCAICRPT